MLYVIDTTFKQSRVTAHYREIFAANNAAQAVADAVKYVSAHYSDEIVNVEVEKEI